MDELIRNVAWAIAEAWWRKTHRRAAGALPEASSSQEYADNFWQGFTEEASAAIAVMQSRVGSSWPKLNPASKRYA